MKSDHLNPDPKIILASESSSRKRQLEHLGFHFQICPSKINEDNYKTQITDEKSAGQTAQEIARAKTSFIAKEHPRDLILGGDQMAVLDSQVFNKPGTVEKAVESLSALQGKTHILFTAMFLSYQGQTFSHLEKNKMSMRPLTTKQIEKYIQRDHPLNCAGAYALERTGLALFEKIETRDHSAIVGFPLITLINQLIKWKISLPFFN